MRSARTRSGLLIVVELGAEWPVGLFAAAGAAVRRVVAQLDGETPEQLGARLSRLAGRLFAPRTILSRVIVACNERTDAGATAARRSIARLALERLGPSGTLTFAAGARAGGRLRHGLSALSAEVAERAFATVNVRFADETERPIEVDVARVA